MNSIPLTKYDSDGQNSPKDCAGSLNILFVSQPAFDIPINKCRSRPTAQGRVAISQDGSNANSPFDHRVAGPATKDKNPCLPEVSASWVNSGSSARTADFPERGRRESDLFDATLRAVSRRTLRDNDRPELKLVEFSVAAPGAKTVQLAADFTDWEGAPLDLVSFEGGYWSTIVPLPAGTYAYRFLVDGAWHDHRSGGTADLKHAGSLKAYVQIK